MMGPGFGEEIGRRMAAALLCVGIILGAIMLAIGFGLGSLVHFQ